MVARRQHDRVRLERRHRHGPAAGGAATEIVASGSQPSWSPDGAKITYRTATGITVANANGASPNEINTNANDYAPAWSPDGTKIAFVQTGAGSADDVWAMMRAGFQPDAAHLGRRRSRGAA